MIWKTEKWKIKKKSNETKWKLNKLNEKKIKQNQKAVGSDIKLKWMQQNKI